MEDAAHYAEIVGALAPIVISLAEARRRAAEARNKIKAADSDFAEESLRCLILLDGVLKSAYPAEASRLSELQSEVAKYSALLESRTDRKQSYDYQGIRALLNVCELAIGLAKSLPPVSTEFSIESPQYTARSEQSDNVDSSTRRLRLAIDDARLRRIDPPLLAAICAGAFSIGVQAACEGAGCLPYVRQRLKIHNLEAALSILRAGAAELAPLLESGDEHRRALEKYLEANSAPNVPAQQMRLLEREFVLTGIRTIERTLPLCERDGPQELTDHLRRELQRHRERLAEL